MASVGSKVFSLMNSAVVASKPFLHKFRYYGRVELVPPKPSEIPLIRANLAKILNGMKTGEFRNVTVRDALRNTLVTIEIVCWFFIGECIGKRHIVGYKV